MSRGETRMVESFAAVLALASSGEIDSAWYASSAPSASALTGPAGCELEVRGWRCGIRVSGFGVEG